jgi:heme A synthase
VLIVLQWLAGALNVALLAPLWLQLGHLLLADAVWITLVLLAASALADPQVVPATAPGHAPVRGEAAVATGAPR